MLFSAELRNEYLFNEILKTGILRNLYTNAAVYYLAIIAINLLDYPKHNKFIIGVLLDDFFFAMNLLSFMVRRPLYYERYYIDQLVYNVIEEHYANFVVNLNLFCRLTIESIMLLFQKISEKLEDLTKCIG